MKPRRAIPYKTKLDLQNETNMKCPFCGNKDYAHLEIHHIDDNPTNNDFQNLINLCAICHSKVTKQEISREAVLQKKKELSRLKPFVKKEIDAEFPGGNMIWNRYLMDNLKYPLAAVQKNIEGTIIVQFEVDADGMLSNIEALGGPAELIPEATRVIKESGRWLPANQNGHAVRSYKKQPIIFKIQE